MGCGASSVKVHPTAQRRQLSVVLPTFDELLVASQQLTISDAAGPEVAGHVRKAAKERLVRLAQTGSSRASSASTVIFPEGHEEEDSLPGWSSMDSRAFESRPACSAPMAPDRRLHEQHLCVLDQFQRDVEQAPIEFLKIVESCR
ncbi:unnamed protein product [Symbiodinium natans]|uniref:Uncharacterized protein n=1 Tax=Symbiodinium natans TaxID=878477 RepID=A0A812PWA7_9DINO|nr:unnamed protein product [Symbiodinium natans]